MDIDDVLDSRSPEINELFCHTNWLQQDFQLQEITKTDITRRNLSYQ